jgi:hypothetical protein
MQKRKAKMIRRGQKQRTLTPITLLLYAAGSSPAEVARLSNVKPPVVTDVCKGIKTSANVQKTIAKILKRPWAEIAAAI